MTEPAVILPEERPARRSFANALRPRYFPGQMLQAADLNEVIAWAGDGFAEARSRDGWGIAAGLELAADPARPGVVLLEPGYALDDAGRSIVVGQPLAVDLAAPWAAWLKSQDEPPAALADDILPPFPGAVPFAVTLRYAETLKDPRPVLAYQGRTPADPSQPARVEEGCTVEVKPIAAGADPATAAAAHWEAGWKRTLAVFDVLADELLAASGDKVRARLMRWIDRHPLRRLPALDALIRELPTRRFSERVLVTRLLFWMVQDYRGQYLDDSAAGTADDGVAAGRLWLAATPGAKTVPRLLGVDGTVPWRRPLDAARWPAPPGETAAAGVIGSHCDDAAAELARAGVPTAWFEPVDPARCPSLAALRTLLDGPAFARAGEPQVLSVLSAPGEPPRVVGVRAAEPAPWAGLRLEAGADRRSAQPGETVALWAELRNIGRIPLEVAVAGGRTGDPVLADQSLTPKGRLKSQWQWRVPHDLEPDGERVVRLANGNLAVRDTLGASGRPECGGEAVAAEAVVELIVEQPLGLLLDLRPLRPAVAPGGLARFALEASNTGRVALTVAVRLRAGEDGPEVEECFHLPPGRQRSLGELGFRVPARAHGHLTVNADAIGNVTDRAAGDADQRRTRATASCVILVRDPRYVDLPLIPWLVWLRLRAWWRGLGS